jgi:replication factor A1
MSATMRSLARQQRSDRDLTYLLLLAKKYDLEPETLHDALQRAKSRKESTCGSLAIQLRQREDSRLCYMFSQNKQSVAQAVLSEASLAKLRQLPPESKRLLDKKDKVSASTDCSKAERHIADLQVGLRHVSLTAKVTDKSEVRSFESRDGTPLALSVATISDGTGHIRLPLWNGRIDSVAKNDTILIRDATVSRFRGELQLSLPWRTGSISTVHSAKQSAR